MGQHTPFPEACTTHLHRAAARTCMLRSRSDHCLSPPCPTTPQGPVSRLTMLSHPICAELAVQYSVAYRELCCCVARHDSEAQADHLCRAGRESVSRPRSIRSRCCSPGPKALPGQSQDRGRVSSPLSESMLQILPCTVVPPNLDMGWVGVGG